MLIDIPAFDAQRLKDLRQALGLTQEAFAHHLGVSLSAVGKWERGETRPHHRLVIKALLEAEREVDAR